ncbi:MAG: PHB depolymerase family esterase [Rhodospirillaceae bacterium]
MAEQIASPAGLVRSEITTRMFLLTTFSRITDQTAPVAIYIEGDGFAWVSRTEPSTDPTPRNPVGLQLAARDTSPNVIYLARPCQYSKGDPSCAVTFWTDRRFSAEVVASMDEAITIAIHSLRNQSIHLVGYSGGGGIAALIAHRRQDVASLRTVAGNIDHRLFTRLHDVTAMTGSQNPVDIASQLASLPQVHFVGDDDTIVPIQVAESFVRAIGDNRCATITRVANVTHGDGWPQVWDRVGLRLPQCRK